MRDDILREAKIYGWAEEREPRVSFLTGRLILVRTVSEVEKQSIYLGFDSRGRLASGSIFGGKNHLCVKDSFSHKDYRKLEQVIRWISEKPGSISEVERLLQFSTKLAAQRNWPVRRTDALVRRLLYMNVSLAAVMRLAVENDLDHLEEAAERALRATWGKKYVDENDRMLDVAKLLAKRGE